LILSGIFLSEYCLLSEPSQSLRSFISRLPKVELHLHLEGSPRPETLLELSRRKGRLERETQDWISERARGHFRYLNFREFLQAFKLVSLLLETPSDYALVTTRLLEWLAAQNVKYVEIMLAVGVLLWKEQSVEGVFEAVSEAAREVGQRLSIQANWIFDAVRQFGTDHVREVLRWAARFRSAGVVALGIGGDEERGPAKLFTQVYQEARDWGLHLTAHAGEAAGPESIRQAVELLGAERIGHGLTAARDSDVMALLHDRRVPLEVCPTSNVGTGLLARVDDHPLPRFLQDGLVVTLNSDDPGMFCTSLEDEFVVAAKAFSLTPSVVARLCENAIGAAFLPENEKEPLLENLRRAVSSVSGVGAPSI